MDLVSLNFVEVKEKPQEKVKYKGKCLYCGKESLYSSYKSFLRVKKMNKRCNKCSENKGKFLICSKGFIQEHTEESKEKMRQAKLGRKLSKEHRVKIGIKIKGIKHSDEAKQRHRIATLKRLEKLGINQTEDKGSKEWFANYNKINNSNFQPKRFLRNGYCADGYDSEKHIWMEFDTPYHKRVGQKEKDLIRQQNIIKYFEEIGEPLVQLKRYITWENKLKTVYNGAYGV